VHTRQGCAASAVWTSAKSLSRVWSSCGCAHRIRKRRARVRHKFPALASKLTKLTDDHACPPCYCPPLCFLPLVAIRGCERRRWLEIRPAVKRAFRVSLNSNAVIIIHRTGPRGIVPVPGIVVAVLWRSFQLLLRYAGAITAQVRVVLQRLPG
jgi:hypothetical protein